MSGGKSVFFCENKVMNQNYFKTGSKNTFALSGGDKKFKFEGSNG